MKKITIYLIGILGLFVGLQSCDYNEFENPPANETDIPTVTHTIQQLKNMYIPGGTVVKNDIVISGKVISSDRNGNIYKNLIIQDETAGIEIKINTSGLYNFYKTGQLIYLKCKNLQLGAYGENVSIGAVPVDDNYENDFIPYPVMGNYVVKGALEMPVEPKTLTIPELDEKYADMFVQINDVEFLESELSLTYANAENQLTQNRTLIDQNGERLVVRTSGYARFAGTQIAQGSGDIAGILTYYYDTPQLTIIRLSDVELTQARF